MEEAKIQGFHILHGFFSQAGEVHPHVQIDVHLIIHRFPIDQVVFHRLFQIFFKKFVQQILTELNDQMQQGYRQQSLVFLGLGCWAVVVVLGSSGAVG